MPRCQVEGRSAATAWFGSDISNTTFILFGASEASRAEAALPRPVSELQAKVQPPSPVVRLGLQPDDELIDVGLRWLPGQQRLPTPTHLGTVAPVLAWVLANYLFEVPEQLVRADWKSQRRHPMRLLLPNG
jgi:hypothetical protein